MSSQPYWPRIWELFEHALELPAEERSPWLGQQCGDDKDALKEVEGLLAAHFNDTGVLERSVQPLAAEALCEPNEIQAGQRIGPYRILNEIGRGGMGVVYKAEDTRLERTVALKFLAPHLVADREIRERFAREAKAAATLNHPNICTVYEIEEIEGRTFISMAYIDGYALDEKIKQGPLKLSEALDISVQAAEGLAEAHTQGIVHRDVKPGNIMIKARERSAHQAVLMDFGLARLVRRSTLTRVGTRVGTVSYMSPEQTEGSKVDQRSDIWALGVVLYEMVAGLPPFRGEYDEAVLYSILNEDPAPLTSVRAGLPVELDWIVGKALAKTPEERYQSVDEFVTDLRRLSHQIESGRHKAYTPRPGAATALTPPMSAAQRRTSNFLWIAALPAVALVSIVLTWLALRNPSPPINAGSDFQLTRITRDSGLATTPALSPDGGLVAFASDRAGQGNLDIWLQQTSLAGAVRLTSGDADEYEPTFSPDGSRIVFRSERDGGGLYAIPVLGGDPRLIAPNGRGAKFSRDGKLLAFYMAAPGTLEWAKLFVVSSDGGVPRQLQSDLQAAALPVWAPDGNHIVFWGKHPNEDFDLWATSLGSTELIPLHAVDALRNQSLRLISLDSWSPDNNELVFSGIRRHSVNLWKLPVSPNDWKLAGPAVRLTFGADEREGSAIHGNRYAFTSASRRINVWGLPLDQNGAAAGVPQRLTGGDATDIGVDISADGSRLVFRSNRAGSTDIWLEELPNGAHRELTATPEFESIPKITRDGTKVAFSVLKEGHRLLYVVSSGGGSPQPVCSDCGPPQAWSLDASKIYYVRNEPPPTAIYQLDIASGKREPLLEDSEIPVFVCQLSTDGRWLTFKGDLGTLRTRVFVAPVPESGPVPVQSWIPITEGDTWDDLPRWSTDGRTIYFFSHRDGFRCIWARHFNPATQQPEGEVYSVQHFHKMSVSLSNLSLSEFELAVGRDKLVFPLSEISGNIWMVSPVEAR